MRQSITEYEINGPEPYYDLPLEIYRELWFSASPGLADNNDLLKCGFLAGTDKVSVLLGSGEITIDANKIEATYANWF